MSTNTSNSRRSSGDKGCFTAIIDKAQEAIAVLDSQDIVRYANTAWVKMHGYENRREVEGKHICEFHSKEKFIADIQPLLGEVSLRGQISGPVEHINKNGNRIPTNTTIAALKNQTGQVRGVIVFATDTTEIEHLTEKIRELVSELGKKSAELGSMTGWLEDREKEMEMTEKLLFDRETEVSSACNQMTEYLAERRHTQEQLRVLREMLEKKERQIAGMTGQLRQSNAEQEKLEKQWKIQCKELTTTIEQLHQMVREMKKREVEFLDDIDRDAELVGANAALDQEQLRQLSSIAKKFASA
jgi:PAS domain S-box-containing protein